MIVLVADANHVKSRQCFPGRYPQVMVVVFALHGSHVANVVFVTVPQRNIRRGKGEKLFIR